MLHHWTWRNLLPDLTKCVKIYQFTTVAPATLIKGIFFEFDAKNFDNQVINNDATNMYPFGCAIELARFAKVKIILILFLDFEAVMMQARNTNEDVLRDCPTQLSCKGRCSFEEELENATRFAPHCHCDSYCKRYEDCCADYDQFCANKNRSISAVPKLACVMTESNKG